MLMLVDGRHVIDGGDGGSSAAVFDPNSNVPVSPVLVFRFGTWMVTTTTASCGSTSQCRTL